MKIVILMLLVISLSYSQSYRTLPFPKPVVDPEPPGFNPVEPIYPREVPCKKDVFQHEICTQEIFELKEKIAHLEVQLKELKRSKKVTCLGEILLLEPKLKKYQESHDKELVLDGSESAYEPLIVGNYINELPSFFRNINYNKKSKISCVVR